MSFFCGIKDGAPVEVFALNKAYQEDSFKNKVNLGIGAYRNENGEPWVLPVVRQTEKVLASDETLNKEYLSNLGMETFCTAATKVLLGNESQAFLENRVFSIQTLSGTGSLRVAAEFLAKQLHYKIFYTSVPTWENYELVFKAAGFEERKTYRYWHEEMRGFDIEGMLEDLRNAPENSVIILHNCAHNPTGCDPTREQWRLIADAIEANKLFPVIDCAYHGFATGDLDDDAWTVRYFVSRRFEFFCSQCFAKNFGLYNERVGNLICVVKDPAVITNVKSQLTIIVRGMYSSPPCHGAIIVAHILSNPYLFDEWKVCIRKMASRAIKLRRSLRESLEKLGTPGTWDHITSQLGMYSYTGLNEQQCLHMVHKHHLYILCSGRMNMFCLNSHNMNYVANAIYETVTSVIGPKL